MKQREDMPMAMGDVKIGSRVRELREKNRYTLHDLAARSGLEKAVLEQIENDEVMPPVATLLHLARALNVGLAAFFQTDRSDEAISVTRHDERRRVERRPHHHHGEVQYIYESLETRIGEKHMEPFLVEFPALGTEEMVFVSHEGEEFLYLLEGDLEFRTADRVEHLQPGDTVYFRSDMNHSFRCISESSAKAVVVIWNKP